jgi:hypothetical protein
MKNKNSYNIDVIKKEPTNVDSFMILLIQNVILLKLQLHQQSQGFR